MQNVGTFKNNLVQFLRYSGFKGLNPRLISLFMIKIKLEIIHIKAQKIAIPLTYVVQKVNNLFHIAMCF